MLPDVPRLLLALAWTTDVPAAQRAIETHSEALALELGKNSHLDPGTWTRMWKTHRSHDWRQALVLARLDPARQDLVISRERDLEILRLFACANPDLTDEQKSRMAYRDPHRAPDQAHARLMGILDALPDASLPRGSRRRGQTVAERAALARTPIADTTKLPSVVPHAQWLSTELAGDTPDTWTAAVTLIDGIYTGTLRELVTTSRLLAAPARAVSVAAPTGAAREPVTRGPIT